MPDILTPDTQYAILEERLTGYKLLMDQGFLASKEAVAAALSAQDKAVSAAFMAQEKASGKAEISQTRVNESLNEFRGAMKDQQSTLMPRAETELLIKEARTQIDSVKTQLVESEGRRHGLSVGWGYLVGTIGTIMAVVMAIHTLFK